MYKRLIFFISCMFFILAHSAFCQQRPIYSQYMFNGLVLNPAYAGNQKQLSATVMHRDQWVNIEGAPKTQTLTVHSALKKWPVGMGVLISRDRIGVHDDLSLYGSYAYKIKLPVGTLALGIQGGFNYTVSDFTKLSLLDPSDPFFNGSARKFKPNFGTGAYFSTNNTYIGFSIPFLLNNKIFTVENVVSEAREARYYFLTGGHVFPINEVFQLVPSVLFRVQEGQPAGVDINSNVFIADVLNVGASYRSGDAVTFLFEIILNSNFRFGYSYDYTLSNIQNYTDGTHELMLNYRINIGKDPCHAYF